MNKKQQVAEKLASEARKNSPWSLRSVVLYILAFIYVLSPIDLIPDALLGFGQLDDAAVVIAAIFYVVRLLRRK